MKLFRKLQPLARHALVYLLVILLPVSLVMVSLTYSRSAMQQEIISANIASVEQVCTSMSSTFQDLRNVLSVAGTDPSLSKYHLLQDPASASDSIRNIISGHSMLSDMILYVRDTEQFCSASGSFDTSTLHLQSFVKDFTSAGYTLESWLSLMQESTTPSYWANPGKSQTAYLYLITPVYYIMQNDGTIARRTACMVIRQEYVKDIFLSSQTSADEGMMLLNSEGIPLSRLTNRTSEGYVAQICNYIRANPNIYKDGYAEIPGSDLLVFVARSADDDLTYVRFLSKSVAYGALQTQNSFGIAFLVLALILGCLLIITNTQRAGGPMMKLANWMQASRAEPAAVPSPIEESVPPAEETPAPMDSLLADLFSESCLDYDLGQLDYALTAHNGAMAHAVLQRLRAVTKLSEQPESNQKLISDITLTLQKHAPLSAPEEPIDPSDPDAVFDSFSTWIQAVLSSQVKQSPLVHTDIGAQLLKYIDAHCLSYDFQIKNMAEHFTISPQYMRKLFKAHVGVSLSEYVSNKRLEKATYLLSQTDMNLSDIVAEIGNSDISGFVRFFKQKTGMTPGQFRKTHKEQG